ncbi:MAG: hypothetical protein HC771_07450 [Synechococcales cyanobacterium CRU_2_2]|nr:hypothetical protein [Synechococcales cyanobacterium CRU_2_2]
MDKLTALGEVVSFPRAFEAEEMGCCVMTFSGREASEGAIWGGLEGVDEAADAEELVWGKLGELLFDFCRSSRGVMAGVVVGWFF